MKKIFCLLILLTFLTSCQKEDVQNIKRLRVNFQEGDLPSLHPHDLVIYLRGLSISKALFEPLTRVNADGGIHLAGAKSVELSEDQLHYTFILRPNNWSDGTPVTASHYERAWKAALAPNSSCSRADLLYPIKNGMEAKKGIVPLDAVGVQALDAETLHVELAYPSPHFLELVAQAIAFPLLDSENREVLHFNGPFVVDSWKKGDSLCLKPNPYYWDLEHIALDQIDITFIEDINTAYSLYEKGEINWMGVPFCPLSAELIQAEKNQEQLKFHAIGRSFWVFLNTESYPLNSPAIRRALSLAIDRHAVTDHVLIGGEPSQKPLSFQLLPVKPHNTLEENILLAQEEFEKGLSELGVTRQDFPPLEISYSQQAMRKQFAEYLQETWRKNLNLEVRLKSVEWNVLRSNLEKGLYTISMAYEGAYYKDPVELLERYTARTPSNFSQWIYPPFVEKIAAAKQEKNGAVRDRLISEAESILLDQMPFIPICSDRMLYMHSPHLKGFVIDSIGALDLSRVSFIDSQ